MKKPSVSDECLWASSDHSDRSLRVKVRNLETQTEPDIVVTKTSITYEGQPVTESISEDLSVGDARGQLHATDAGEVAIYWPHGKTFHIHLVLEWNGSTTLKAAARIDPMKKLALKVEAALGAEIRPR